MPEASTLPAALPPAPNLFHDTYTSTSLKGITAAAYHLAQSAIALLAEAHREAGSVADAFKSSSLKPANSRTALAHGVTTPRARASHVASGRCISDRQTRGRPTAAPTPGPAPLISGVQIGARQSEYVANNCPTYCGRCGSSLQGSVEKVKRRRWRRWRVSQMGSLILS